MLLGETFAVALSSIRSNALRAMLTMLGIIIGVAAVITMVALGSGAQKAVEERIAALGANLFAVFAGQEASFDPTDLAHNGMRIVGTKMGSALPADDIPRLVALYEDGRLKLDELVTAICPLDAVNDAVESMRRGEAIRNVIAF